MKRTILFFLILISCFFQLMAQNSTAESDTFIYYIVRTDDLYLRNKPDASAKNIVMLNNSDTVIVLDTLKNTGWIKIKANNQIGYVPNKYIKKITSTPQLRFAELIEAKVNQYTHWKSGVFWIILSVLILLSLVFSYVNKKLDISLYNIRKKHISSKFFKITSIIIAAILALFFMANEVEFINYFAFSSIILPPEKGLFQFCLWLISIFYSFLVVLYIFKYISAYSFGYGLFRSISQLFNNTLWIVCVFYGTVGLFIPALVIFGIIAYIYGLFADKGSYSVEQINKRKEYQHKMAIESRQRNEQAREELRRTNETLKNDNLKLKF